MWQVAKPEFNALDTFKLCITKVRSSSMKRRLESISSCIQSAADDYVVKAEAGELHLISRMTSIGSIPGSEMVKTYTNRMAKKGQPGRDIYDKIKMLPENDTCPFCGHRDVSTLDHVLPKADYPAFAVTPVNLVGSCGDCNKLKLAAVPSCASDALLHPYFDAASDRQWLSARVVVGPMAAVTFYVLQVAEFDASLNARIAHQFRVLGLAKLYSSQAAREMAGIRANLMRHRDSGGAAAVRLELRHQFESRQASQINSWQTATYQALSQSDWFCDGGFSLL
jgi:hypothetical protein